MVRYTVDSLFEKAGKSHSKHKSSKQGYDFDHIVELQLVVAALNDMQSEYQKEALGTLVDFFNSGSNLREVPAQENRNKGQAVKRFIEHSPSLAGDKDHIQTVRNHWNGNLEGKLQNFEPFKEKLNKILKRQV